MKGSTTGALGVVVNAVVDALAEFGVTHIEMPVTPERVWRAIQSAKARRALEEKMPDLIHKTGPSCASL